MPRKNIPQHIAFILDGNRRWAKEHGLPSLEGHRQGAENFKKITEAAFRRGVKFVSAFIFSTENWNRAADEVNYLMDLALKIFTRDVKEMHKKGIRVVWLGIEDKLSDKHKKAIKEAVDLTKNNVKGTLAICFNYGGKQEIIDACKSLVAEGKTDIAEADIATHLYAPELPDIDLLVRTSGEQRLSNFQLWRAAYAELLFMPKHWPAFSEADLDAAIDEFDSRQRRFGV